MVGPSYSGAMRIALAQLTPTSDPRANVAAIIDRARAAAAGGARLVIAPEGAITDAFGDPGSIRQNAEPLDGPFVTALQEASAELDIVIAAGTFVPADDGRVSNVLAVLRDGALIAAYRKIHLYDAFSHRESAAVVPGDEEPPILEIDGLRIGLATCYDLRFPELFRSMSARGVDVLAVASAWAAGSGKEDHWVTLLRARAIENTSYVVAADQMGSGCIGRSAAFDPFGLPLLDLGYRSPALGFADVDHARLAEVRELLPSGSHARMQIRMTAR